jgi:hypothetical protein
MLISASPPLDSSWSERLNVGFVLAASLDGDVVGAVVIRERAKVAPQIRHPVTLSAVLMRLPLIREDASI